jgi:hypothetical protein
MAKGRRRKLEVTVYLHPGGGVTSRFQVGIISDATEVKRLVLRQMFSTFLDTCDMVGVTLGGLMNDDAERDIIRERLAAPDSPAVPAALEVPRA